MRSIRHSRLSRWHGLSHWHLGIAAAVLAGAGCSDRAGDLPRTELQSATATTVIVPPLESIQAAAWTSHIVYSTLGMDSLQIEGTESLFARILPDGSLAVANGPRIVLLNHDGSFGRTLARDGDGPGEFRVISSLGIGSDGSLFATDHLSSRFTELSPGGELRRFIPRLRPISAQLDNSPFAVLSDGQIIAAPWQARPARKLEGNEAAVGIFRDPIPIVTFDSTGGIADTLLLLPGLERSNGFVAPFPQLALYAGRGRRWVAGVSDSLDFQVFDGMHPTIHLLARRTGVSASIQDHRSRDSLIGEQWGAEMAPVILKRQADMPVTGRLPDIGGIGMDDAGAIWVGAYAAPGSAERQWYLFGTGGDCLGQLALPAFVPALLPTQTELLDAADGRVALIRETSDGEVYIEVRQVRRDPPSSPLSGSRCGSARAYRCAHPSNSVSYRSRASSSGASSMNPCT